MRFGSTQLLLRTLLPLYFVLSCFTDRPFLPASAMQSVSVAHAFLDGQSVPCVFDAWLSSSFCPQLWFRGSPSHVSCQYINGFSFACLLPLSPSSSIGCLMLGSDWINAVVVACHCALFLFLLLSLFLIHYRFSEWHVPFHTLTCPVGGSNGSIVWNVIFAKWPTCFWGVVLVICVITVCCPCLIFATGCCASLLEIVTTELLMTLSPSLQTKMDLTCWSPLTRHRPSGRWRICADALWESRAERFVLHYASSLADIHQLGANRVLTICATTHFSATKL